MDGDEVRVAKSITIFKEQASRQIPLLQKYLSESDWPLLSNSAHVLKTMTSYLGLDELVILSQTIEHMADSGEDIESIRPHLTSLIENLRIILEMEE